MIRNRFNRYNFNLWKFFFEDAIWNPYKVNKEIERSESMPKLFVLRAQCKYGPMSLLDHSTMQTMQHLLSEKVHFSRNASSHFDKRRIFSANTVESHTEKVWKRCFGEKASSKRVSAVFFGRKYVSTVRVNVLIPYYWYPYKKHGFQAGNQEVEVLEAFTLPQTFKLAWPCN